jgi:short-subunit dehydrogenase
MSNNAILTGASSGIGKAIALSLIKEDITVYAIARDFSKCDIKHKNFIPINLDLSHTDEIQNLTNYIKDDIDILINCAGIGIFSQHEDIKIQNIQNLININLTAPIILSKLFLKEIKKNSGYIINITSIEAIKRSKFSALYTATKAGLKAFSECLFEEARKDGVKVISINPDITKTNFFDKLNFKYFDDKEYYISADEIADTIIFILKNKNIAFQDITIRAQKFRLSKK